MARGPGKGNTNNPKGRPQGAKGEKTLQWEKLGSVIVSDSAERFMTVLDNMDDEDFIKAYLQILEYFKPKQQRREVDAHIKNDVNINPKKWVDETE